MKYLTALAVFGSAVLPAFAQQEQVVLDEIHNTTSIVGTWSSGSRAVRTGAGFANPANQTFTYPKNSGISYSFSDDGHFELARYRFNSNASEPNCIQGVVNWAHGKYTLQPNGSITFDTLPDGFQQIQNPCVAQSNFIEPYDRPELYRNWRIFEDTTAGPKLHLFQFDGAPLAPMFRVANPPVMLPTRLLRNVTTDQVDGVQGGSVLLAGGGRNGAGHAGMSGLLMAGGLTIVAVLL